MSSQLGIAVPKILLPRAGTDLATWAVVACDQYTSQPDYWRSVDARVGDAPSTARLVFPEVWLGKDDEVRIPRIQGAMRRYLDERILVERECFVLVERTTDGPHGRRTRRGLVLAVDLEAYDYMRGSSSLVRATEGTILERLPPRIRIREGAPLELPHIMLLIDDPARTTIEPLFADLAHYEALYDVELMAQGGHLRGWAMPPAAAARIEDALAGLADSTSFRARYGLTEDRPVLLYAVGDGNHSLATAKAVWQKVKATLPPDARGSHPARWALVEVVNVHDEGLAFEPIHRVLFDLRVDFEGALREAFGDDVRLTCCDRETMFAQAGAGTTHRVGLVRPEGFAVVAFMRPTQTLPVATLQSFLDGFMKGAGAREIDYVHGDDVVCDLGSKPGQIGLYLPSMDKGDLFRTVILDGALPRKTFSMGEAHEKRFYMECRKIVP